MGRKTKMALMALATVGILGAVTVSGFGVKSAFADDADRQHPVATRVAEILGVEEDRVVDAFEQVHDEMPEHMRGGMGMKRAQMGLQDIADCIGVDLDELTQEYRDGDSTNLEGALISLGYDDIDSAKACVKDAMLERMEEKEIPEDKAAEMLENIDEKIDFMFSHEAGERPEFDGEMRGGMGRGMGERMNEEK